MRNSSEVEQLEQEIHQLTAKLHRLRRDSPGEEVPNYFFDDQSGKTNLLDLFGDQTRLLMIHNMGQGCRYCTLWADGFNGLLPHLESEMAVVLTSKDSPKVQRQFANSRGWRFRLASHQGSPYLKEQGVDETGNMPGAVTYEREGETIFRRNSCLFGPGDLYCSLFSLLGLAGIDGETWVPQFRYWTAPNELDDGGQDLRFEGR